jgi:hypothetical protein
MIALKHQCKLTNYKNFKKCYVALGSAGHLPILTRALTTWNTAINDSKVTTDVPPIDIVRTLFVEQAQAKSSPFF